MPPINETCLPPITSIACYALLASMQGLSMVPAATRSETPLYWSMPKKWIWPSSGRPYLFCRISCHFKIQLMVCKTIKVWHAFMCQQLTIQNIAQPIRTIQSDWLSTISIIVMVSAIIQNPVLHKKVEVLNNHFLVHSILPWKGCSLQNFSNSPWMQPWWVKKHKQCYITQKYID